MTCASLIGRSITGSLIVKKINAPVISIPSPAGIKSTLSAIAARNGRAVRNRRSISTALNLASGFLNCIFATAFRLTGLLDYCPSYDDRDKRKDHRKKDCYIVETFEIKTYTDNSCDE